MRAARVAIVLCMALSTLLGTWYLQVRIPQQDWLNSCRAGREALELGRFGEAERHFLAAVEAARAFGEEDRRLAHSQFFLAQRSSARPGRRKRFVCSNVPWQSTPRHSGPSTRSLRESTSITQTFATPLVRPTNRKREPVKIW